jgi:3-hydroxyisobutyrate dehydrogenase-like beta-hydroxyacid dehydrogenase
MATIGFIGASGLMGHGIAKNLQARGHALHVVVHRRRDRLADLFDHGAHEAAAPAALAAPCDVVFTCVTGTPEVEAAILGADGVLAGVRDAGRRGLVIVDCSTSEPASTSALREACRARDAIFIDAPLARSAAEAEAGRLTVMVGAEDADFARLEPLLRCFAENIFHVGGPGTGHVVKLLYNFMAQAICTSAAEAFGVGARAGVDLHQLAALTTAGAANSPLFQMMAKALDGDLGALRFELDNARKDLRYYTHLAEGLAVPAIVGEAVHQSLTVASALGHGAKFVPALVEAQETLARTRIVGGHRKGSGHQT